MSKFIEGKKLLNIYNIRDFELFECVKKGLQPYNKDNGKPIPPPNIPQKRQKLDYFYEQKKRLQIKDEYLHASIGKRYAMKDRHKWLQSEYTLDIATQTPNGILYESQKIKKAIEDIKKEIRREIYRDYPVGDYSWTIYEPVSQDEEILLIGCVAECLYQESESRQILGRDIPFEKGQSISKKKLTPHQRRREECCRIAERLWNKLPDMTIVEMYHHDDIKAAFESHPYGLKTFRNWVKELCPNRSPGRRPKKK
jgi:hypothetical protein